MTDSNQNLEEQNWIQTGDQYRDDVFNKLKLPFVKGRKLLDVGCGSGSNAKIFINEFGLKVDGIDVYEHEDVKSIRGLRFKKASIFGIPHKDNSFDYVFLHDILHHIDEAEQSYEKHIRGLKELKRVCKGDGYIIIVEANRYNLFFYPHMVLMKGHNHFKQSYFRKIILDIFDNVQFKTFEAHLYPARFVKIFKVYEKVMKKFSFLEPFLAYNVAVIKNDK